MSTRSREVPALTALALLSALGAGACSLFEKSATTVEIDPVTAQAYLQRNFTKIPKITDALARIVATVNGSPQTGVTFTPITGGVQGTVGVDLDSNGSMETTVAARIIFNNPSVGIAGGAVLTVTSLDAPSSTGSASANIAVQGTNTVQFTSGQATLHPTNGPTEITVSNGNLTATASFTNPLILGSADFSTGAKSGTAIFESNGSGGFRLRVTSNDFTGFTVP